MVKALVEIAGICSVVAGVAMFSVPFALIVLGVATIVIVERN
jgi:hypothetical protein